MKDNGSMKRLISITMDRASQSSEDDKKVKSKEHEKAGSVTKTGKAGKKGKAAVVVDGLCY